jgi:hypothetical protein
MSPEQKNKAVSWFCRLPEHIQGILCLLFILCFVIYKCLYFSWLFLLATVLADAASDSGAESR